MIPGAARLFHDAAAMALYFGSSGSAHGAAECTLPSIINGIPGAAVRVWMDAYRVVERVSAACVPARPAAADRSRSSRRFWSPIRTTSRPAACTTSRRRLTSIYDNIFFSTASLLGDGFNQQAAATLGALNPSIAASALKFTRRRSPSCGQLQLGTTATG